MGTLIQLLVFTHPLLVHSMGNGLTVLYLLCEYLFAMDEVLMLQIGNIFLQTYIDRTLKADPSLQQKNFGIKNFIPSAFIPVVALSISA
jgi:hypothetical protein